MPARANSSARSFSGWPAWPRSQCQRTSWRAWAASSLCHRSAFLTGCLALVLGGEAVARAPALARGVNVLDGKITYEAVAEAHGLDFHPLEDVLPLSPV